VQTRGMSNPITPTELAERAGISVPYASQVLSGQRGASLGMAFKIYDSTGLQLGILKGLSEETVEELRPKAAA
jgi:transcriptional regulator with XRE-family HTH domain